jgi:hypothetical protein
MEPAAYQHRAACHCDRISFLLSQPPPLVEMIPVKTLSQFREQQIDTGQARLVTSRRWYLSACPRLSIYMRAHGVAAAFNAYPDTSIRPKETPRHKFAVARRSDRIYGEKSRSLVNSIWRNHVLENCPLVPPCRLTGRHRSEQTLNSCNFM